MKSLIKIGLLLLLVAMILAPSAEATIRIQSVSSGLFNFDGPTRATYSGNTFGATYYNANDRMYVGTSSRVGGPSVGLQFQRPTSVRQHYFEDQNKNYRTIERGDWRLTQAQANWPNQQTSIGVGRVYDQYSVRGTINGYTGAPSYGSPNAFARAHTSFPYFQTQSGFGYARTSSAYTSTGSAYY